LDQVLFFLGFKILVPSGATFDEDLRLFGSDAVPGRTDDTVGPGGMPGTPGNCWWCPWCRW